MSDFSLFLNGHPCSLSIKLDHALDIRQMHGRHIYHGATVKLKWSEGLPAHDEPCKTCSYQLARRQAVNYTLSAGGGEFTMTSMGTFTRDGREVKQA